MLNNLIWEIKRLKKIRILGKNNRIEINCKIRNGKVNVRGNNNEIIIPKSCFFGNAMINIIGDNNKLIIHEKARLLGPCKINMEGNSTLILGVNCGIRGVDFKLKNANIQVGERCMFSYGINIRNHDSHRVFEGNDPLPSNPASDIILGKHVWICENSSILKGVKIGDDAIVAYGAVVTKDCPANGIIAGNPARVVKQNISWDY